MAARNPSASAADGRYETTVEMGSVNRVDGTMTPPPNSRSR